jgi:multisubunit Na+/H+ antiporter MnhG subunit
VDADAGTAGQRVIAVLVLLVAGVLSQPIAAAFLDGEGSENLIIPAQLVGMALLGAAVGGVLPALAGAGSSNGHGAKVGAVLGVVLALVGVAIFFVLLNGF